MTEEIIKGSPTFVEDVGNALQNYLYETNISASELAVILEVPDRTMKGVLYREQVVESVEGFYALLRYVTGIEASDQSVVPSRIKRGGRGPGSHQEVQRAWTEAQISEWMRRNKTRLETMSHRLAELKEKAKQRPPLKGLKPGRDVRHPDPVAEPAPETASEWAKKAARALKSWAKKKEVSLRQIARDLNISRGAIETIGRGNNVLRDLKIYADLYDHTGLAQLDPRTVPPLLMPTGRGTGTKELERQWSGKEEWLAKHSEVPETAEQAALTIPVFVRADTDEPSAPRTTQLLTQLAEQIEVERGEAVDDAITRFVAEMRTSQSDLDHVLTQQLDAMKQQQDQFLALAAEKLGIEWNGFSTAVLNRAGFILKRAINGEPSDLQELVTENKRALLRLLEYLLQIPAIQPEQPKVPDVIVDGDDMSALMARLDELLAPFVTKERSSADRDRLLTIYREPLGRLFKKLSTLTMSTGHREMVVEEGKVNQ